MTRRLETSGAAAGAQLRLTLLGAPRITYGGQPLPFAYEKAQALLAYLAVEAGRAHRRAALADLLWPEHDAAAARHNLSQALFILRRALGDDPQRPLLLTTRDTVQLNPSRAVALDVATFRALVSDQHSTPAQLEQAAALYGGEFLAGFSIGDSAVFEEWATLVREQLHRQMGELLGRLTEPQEGPGDAARTLDHARRWVELDPLNEEAQRRLIRALFEAGQRSAALAQFELCRRLLRDELGLEPEPATLALVEDLRRREAPTPMASRPRPARRDVPRPAPQAGARAAAHSRAYAVPFVGRASELADVTARLANPDCRLLTLTGLGGSGKTRLAIEAASRAASSFPHGAFFVSLQPLPRSDLLVPAIAQALGLAPEGDAEPLDQLLDDLQDKRLLLILDNVEHLLDGVSVLSSVLAHAPGVTVLATSREALRLGEEWLYPLGGLSTPDAQATSPADYDAVQLFLTHARRAQPGLRQEEELETIACICRMTAGLPLAIELAASWLKGSSVARIAHEMQRSLDVLATTTRNVEERHRSMRAVFSQSWERLEEPERLVFARLSVFSGAFDGDAAEAVAGASFTSMAALVEKSLVQLEPGDRFGVHELLRQYATEQLEASGETEATCARHARYFAQLVRRHEAALRQPRQNDTLRALEHDWEHIRSAWEWSATNRQMANLDEMLHGLYLFGFLRSRHPELIGLFQQTLDQRVVDAPLFGRLLARRWGYLQWSYQASYGEALAGVERALAIAQAENDEFELAFCHLMIAYAVMSMGRYADALPALERSRALFEAIDEPYYLCWVLHRLGYAYANLNDIARGNHYTEQSMLLARATHNRAALVICLYNLGSDYILKGDYISGRQFCTEALQVASAAEHQSQIAHASNLVALCAFLQGEHSVCMEYLERAQSINEKLNRFVYRAYGLSLLILLACLREDYAEGMRLSALAQWHSTNTMGYQLLYWARAALACGLGRLPEARAHIQQALRLAVPEVNPGPTTWIAPCAACALAEIDPAAAVELLAWAASSPHSASSWARSWPLVDRLLGQLQGSMQADAYALHWERGKALTFASIATSLQRAFRVASPETGEVMHHTLEVAVRTHAAVRAQG